MAKENTMKKDIGIEIDNLERLVKEMEEIRDKSGDKPDFIKTRAAGSILHDFYCGLEKIFERIAIHIDGGIPNGEDWHIELLLQMGRPLEGIRDVVINGNLLERLKEYLRFRHLFRHIYGFELNWERFRNLSLGLPSLFSDVKNELERFGIR